MTYAADLHLHSSYAMATSPSITLESMASWAAIKGIDVLATADFTHPAWLAELKAKLLPLDDGLFALRARAPAAARFVLGTEVSCVYTQDGRTRRLHLLVLAPDFAAVDRLCAAVAVAVAAAAAAAEEAAGKNQPHLTVYVEAPALAGAFFRPRLWRRIPTRTNGVAAASALTTKSRGPPGRPGPGRRPATYRPPRQVGRVP